MKYSIARRNGLTVELSRRLPLQRVVKAFQLDTTYRDKVVKVMVER